MADSREFDVIVLGATGATGRWIVRHLADRASQTGARWAVAARDSAKLERVLDEIEVLPSNTIIADALDPKSTRMLASRAKVVVNAAGPYTSKGRELIEACVGEHTHYVDLAGETPFVRRIIDEFHDAAVAADVKVVQMCGFASVPADLGVLLAAETAHERWEQPLADVDLQLFLKAPPRLRPSDIGGAGTYRSFAESIEDPDSASVSDPAVLIPTKTLADRVRHRSPLSVAPRLDGWAPVAPMMFQVTPAVVHRTAALLAAERSTPPQPFTYREGWLLHGGMTSLPLRFAAAGALSIWQAAMRGVTRARPAVRRRVTGAMRAVIPASGHSPPLDRQCQWESALSITARTDAGRRLFIYIASEGYFAYLATGRITGEAALLLSEDGATPKRGGCLTPAVALGTGCIERFEHAGVQFSVDC